MSDAIVKFWFVAFPTFRYEQKVEALAREKGLRIIDARFDDGTGEEDVPELTLKPEYQPKESESEEESVLFNVFKVVDGERAERASKYGLTAEEADQFVADNPDNVYEVELDSD